MRMVGKGIVGVLLLGSLASVGQAFWIDAFVDHCQRGRQKNVQWPSPYVCPDRTYAHAPFQAMVRNGWRRQNLLGSHHFNEDSTQLTQAGKLKIQWIMSQAPQQYRRIFVESSLQRETTDARIATASSFATEAGEQMGTGGFAPQVFATHIMSEGRPAATVDFVNSQFRDNMKVPVLPANTAGGQTGQ